MTNSVTTEVTPRIAIWTPTRPAVETNCREERREKDQGLRIGKLQHEPLPEEGRPVSAGVRVDTSRAPVFGRRHTARDTQGSRQHLPFTPTGANVAHSRWERRTQAPAAALHDAPPLAATAGIFCF